MGWLRELDAWQRAMLALMVGGVSLRAFHVGGDSIAADSAWYATMAESLLRNGEFLVPWADGVLYTQHFPPLYPAFLALFFAPAGPSFVALQLAGLVAAALFVAVAFFCTRDLYGRDAAFAVGAVAATLPTLLEFDLEALGETFVAALFGLTIWAILRSLREPRYIVLGGVFAGLGYLAKASMGPFFLFAGAAGFAWRFVYVRWGVFRDRWYLLAAALFASFVVPWAGRNVLRHGWPNWHTQAAAERALDALFAHDGWPLLVLYAFLWILATLASNAIPFLAGALRTLRDWRSDRTSGLLLAIVLPSAVAAFFVGGFSIVEGYDIKGSPHPGRYAITPVLPFLWLCMRELDWSRSTPAGTPVSGSARIRNAAALAVGGAILVALILAFREPYVQANTLGDFALLIAGSGVGLALVAVSRTYAWEPVARQGSQPTWRAVPRKLPWRNVPLALAFFGAAWFFPPIWVPLWLGAACGVLCSTARQRALVVAIVFLGFGMGGGINAQAYDLAAEAAAALAQPGDTISTTVGVEPMLYPFVPENMSMVLSGSASTFLVHPWGDRDTPEGYEVVGRYGKHAALGPASWLRWRAQLLVRGHDVGEPVPTVTLFQLMPPT